MGLAAICAAAMSAAQAEEGSRIDRIDGEQLADLVADAGDRATQGRDSQGDPTISSSASGANFTIYMYGCEEERCKPLQFIAGFDLADGIELEGVNAWNRDKRYGSAYLDDEQDPWLQMDLEPWRAAPPLARSPTTSSWETLLGQFQAFIYAKE